MERWIRSIAAVVLFVQIAAVQGGNVLAQASSSDTAPVESSTAGADSASPEYASAANELARRFVNIGMGVEPNDTQWISSIAGHGNSSSQLLGANPGFWGGSIASCRDRAVEYFEAVAPLNRADGSDYWTFVSAQFEGDSCAKTGYSRPSLADTLVTAWSNNSGAWQMVDISFVDNECAPRSQAAVKQGSARAAVEQYVDSVTNDDELAWGCALSPVAPRNAYQYENADYWKACQTVARTIDEVTPQAPDIYLEVAPEWMQFRVTFGRPCILYDDGLRTHTLRDVTVYVHQLKDIFYVWPVNLAV